MLLLVILYFYYIFVLCLFFYLLLFQIFNLYGTRCWDTDRCYFIFSNFEKCTALYWTRLSDIIYLYIAIDVWPRTRNDKLNTLNIRITYRGQQLIKKNKWFFGQMGNEIPTNKKNQIEVKCTLFHGPDSNKKKHDWERLYQARNWPILPIEQSPLATLNYAVHETIFTIQAHTYAYG